MSMQTITPRGSLEAQALEDRLAKNGSYTVQATSIIGDKLYLGDARNQTFTDDDLLVDLKAYKRAQIAGASGASVDGIKVYGEAYASRFEDYKKINGLLQANPNLTPQEVAISGGAGEQSITNYETIRKSATISSQISGQDIILEDLNAINMAFKESTDGLKHEFLKRTSAIPKVDQEMADNQIPSNIRDVFAVGEHELFADGTSWETSLRDKDLKIDVNAEINKHIPKMFAQSKEDKMIALLNAVSLTNQGDWDAVTGNFYDVRASTQVQAIETAIKAYGGQSVAIMHSDTWALYMDNIGSAFDGKAGNVSTEGENGAKTLPKNPKVKYWINDSITSQTYVMAKLESWMKYIQGAVISTSFKDVRTAGQTSTEFRFDFNGFFENEPNAVGGGSSVGA